MHIVVIAILLFIILYLLLRNQNQPEAPEQEPVSDSSVEAHNPVNEHNIAFISKGKLFIKNASSPVNEIHSPYIQEMIDRMNRSKQLHGWKENTSLSTSFVGQGGKSPSDQVELQMTSAQFLPDNKLLYFMKDRNVGGLFEYNIESGEERRLLHRQNLNYEHLTVNTDNNKILCSQQHDNGIADIVMLSEDNTDYRQLTEGDTVDSAPAWIPGDSGHILYQSSGLARSEDGYVIAHGPASIHMLDLDNNQVVTVREDSGFDFLQPRVDQGGDLYFIKRPYEVHNYNGRSLFMDTLLFPFRLLRALFHYLNFFSLMYSQKPLTSASGPKVNADLKNLLVKGKRINAEKALAKENRVSGIPSLVPRSWQLVKRNKNGRETILATNVAAFDISSRNEILYSNGYAVFELTPDNKSRFVLRDELIADIVAS